MGVTISTYPQHTDLTTLRRVKVELNLALTETTYDELLGNLIAEASEAVESHCHREFARAVVTESVGGSGRLRLVASRTPLVSVSSVVFDDSTVGSTDYSIEDADAGFLYREMGWYWTVPADAYDLVPKWSASMTVPDYVVTYAGGYLLPGDNLSSVTLSAATSTACIKDSASNLPLCAAGDRITLSGWTQGTNNNKSMTVVTRTAAKITVDSTSLTAEASTDIPRTLTVRQAPYGLPRDIERACLETVKAWYYARQHDPTVNNKQVGDLSLGYSVTAMERTIPASAQKLLAPYRRIT